jgi:hypothetical protein
LTNTEADGKRKAQLRLQNICARRGGKFKLTEKQFCEEMELMFLIGEMSGAERILRGIESDDSIDTKDLIRGEIHMFLMALNDILKKRASGVADLKLEDLLWGRFTTDKVLQNEAHQ